MLPDPRRYGRGDDNDALLKVERAGDHRVLVEALRELAAAGGDDEIRAALAAAPSQPAYAALWRALAAAVEHPAPGEAITTRLFAMPWVIVAAGTAPARVQCVLPEVAALAKVFDEHHVFGASRNLGFGNALCRVETLEALAPSALLKGWDESPLREVAPTPIEVLRGVEEVHLRFLLGAAIAPSHAPGVAETGSNVAAWGTPALRAMAAQLATPGVQLLPMPRPPAGLYTAAYAGRRAALEAAFNLFMSNSVRRIRMAVGDPSVTLSAHENGVVRVVLWTQFDDAMVEGFSWPLHPADDLAEIEGVIRGMIADCGLPEPAVHPAVLPDRTPTGAVLFRTV
jgi:hypothetical protein